MRKNTPLATTEANSDMEIKPPIVCEFQVPFHKAEDIRQNVA